MKRWCSSHDFRAEFPSVLCCSTLRHQGVHAGDQLPPQNQRSAEQRNARPDSGHNTGVEVCHNFCLTQILDSTSPYIWFTIYRQYRYIMIHHKKHSDTEHQDLEQTLTTESPGRMKSVLSERRLEPVRRGEQINGWTVCMFSRQGQQHETIWMFDFVL